MAERGAFRPVSVEAAVQAFFPVPPPGTPPRAPATLTVWSVRTGAKGGGGGGGPEFSACATAALPMPATPADAQVGKRVAVDLTGCGPAAAALVFGLTQRFAFFDAPNYAFLTDSYFTLDDLAVCGVPAATSVAPSPPVVYLQSPPVGFANRKRRRRRRLAADEAEEGGGGGGQEAANTAAAPPGNGTAAAAATTPVPADKGTAAAIAAPPTLSPPQPTSPPATPPALPGEPPSLPTPARSGYVAGATQARDGVSPAVAAAALTSAPKAAGAAGPTAAERAAAAAETVAAAFNGRPAGASATAGCFAHGFDSLSWRPTVNHTLETDAYVSYYAPLIDGAGLAWLNAAIVRDATPPPAATSKPHYARPRFPGPVYAFAQAGTFRPVAVSVSPRCEPSIPGAAVAPEACPGPVGPPPVFEVAALRAGGQDGVSGAELSVCATAALGAPPVPPAPPGPASQGIAASGDPVAIDLAGCGPAVLALRFRLVPPFPARELSFALDDLILCPGGGGGGKGGGVGGRGVRNSVAAPTGTTELPVVDPPAWPGTL
jgi:hypothetical protein